MKFSELSIGQRDSRNFAPTMSDVSLFSLLSGDCNPIHVDPEFAEKSIFGGVICHGAMVAGYISAVLGNQLPGRGAIYLEQQSRFLAAVHPGDTVQASVEITDLVPKEEGRGVVHLATYVWILDGAKRVLAITGTAKLLVKG